MSNVVAFRLRAAQPQPEETGIDPLTAIDAAIRDLADIMRDWGSDAALAQAEDCRQMLARAYGQALTGRGCGCCEGE